MKEEKIENKFDFDKTLYNARQIQAGLKILKSMDEVTSELGYHELLQLAWLFCDRSGFFINSLDGIIKDLINAGAKDPEIPA